MTVSQILSGWTVLVIDDDADSLDIMQGLIAHYGASTFTAENGKVGLDLALTMKPDFIITDLSMPIMNGWELIDELKKERTTAGIPIIALTAHALVGDREKAIAAGCHNYLTKPLRPEAFMTQLVQLLRDIPKFADQLQSDG